MSKVINMVGGGSSGGGISSNDAVLVVTVQTGSTVTATKGGVTLTPTMWVTAADPTFDCAIFSIESSLFDAVNPWTVTGTLGTGTASATVIIDSNKQYDLGPIRYPLVLYDSGDQCVDVTGGWQFKPYASSSSSSVTFGATEITINPPNQYSTCVGTVSMSGNKIASYSTLKAELQVLSTGGDSRVGIVPNYNLGSSGIDNKWTAVKIYTTTGTFTASVNISSLTTGYVLLAAWKQKTTYSKIWLEP